MICTKSTFENLRSILEEYGGMDVPEDPKDPDELTWADVCRTVGPDGSYVRVVLINSILAVEEQVFLSCMQTANRHIRGICRTHGILQSSRVF